jgi:hypothetical protein
LPVLLPLNGTVTLLLTPPINDHRESARNR